MPSVIDVHAPSAERRSSCGVGPASSPPASFGSSAIIACAPTRTSCRNFPPAVDTVTVRSMRGTLAPLPGRVASGARANARMILPRRHRRHVRERLLLELRARRVRLAARLPLDHPLEALVERLKLARRVETVLAVRPGLDPHPTA